MATGTLLAFNQTSNLIHNGTVDLSADTIKVTALTATPSATDTTYSQAATGALASNLATNPVTVTGGSVGVTGTNDSKWDATDVQFTAVTGGSTITHFVIWDDTVTSPLDACLFYGDIDGAATSIVLAAGESVTLQWSSSGINRIVYT